MASCERTHIKVKILNHYLRSSMSSDRLEGLVQISSERDIADTMEFETSVDVFKLKSQRRIKLEIIYCHCFMHFRFLFRILPLCQCHCFLTFLGFFIFAFIFHCDTAIIRHMFHLISFFCRVDCFFFNSPL